MTGFLVITGLIILFLGGRALTAPAAAAAAPFDIELRSVTARNQTRASAGGVTLAVGALSVAGAIEPVLQVPALVLLATVLSGLLLGRLYSLLADGRPAGRIWVAGGLELLGLVQAAAWLAVALKDA